MKQHMERLGSERRIRAATRVKLLAVAAIMGVIGAGTVYSIDYIASNKNATTYFAAISQPFITPSTSQGDVATSEEGPATAEIEMARGDVLDVFKRDAVFLGTTPEETDSIGEWLNKVLSGHHRRITASTLRAFDVSLQEFQKNSGVKFKTAAERSNGVLLLKFCCDAAWSLHKEPEERSDVLMRHFLDLNKQAINRVRNEILVRIPPDKLDQWTPEVDKAISHVALQMDEHVKRLHEDFLFPGFKEMPHQWVVDTMFKGLGTPFIIPRYGRHENDPIQWQSDDFPRESDDKDFKSQLKTFTGFFDSNFIGGFAFYDFDRWRVLSKYWIQYDISTSGMGMNPWPVNVGFFPNASATQPGGVNGVEVSKGR